MNRIIRRYLHRIITGFILILFLISSLNLANALEKAHRTDWLKSAKWGVFTHYLTNYETSTSEWNKLVNNFDVNFLAKQLQSVGAKYYFITIGQNSGHYCAPNRTYTTYVGSSMSKCSTRDLVSDLYNALKPLGIKLLVYLPSGAPSLDSNAVSKLDWKSGPYPNIQFQRKWESVIKEWSLRWGNKVEGWWFDGAYWPNEMYRSPTAPNFKSFAAAARAGNPKSIIAFNPGVKYPIISQTPYEDYTAGELEEPWGVVCNNRWVDNAQLHILSYLGSSWGKGLPRYTDEKVVQITKNINNCGGAITWDVPIQSNGHISQTFILQLKKLSTEIKKPTKATKVATKSRSTNLALHKNAKLLDDSEKRSLPVNSAKYFAQLGVDGDTNTVAMAGDEWAWTYQVDLGNTYRISKINITFGKYYATQYRILISKDRVLWTEVANKNNSNGGKYTYNFKPTETRYVKIKAVKPDGPKQKGVQMSIAELEVYR